MHALETLFSYFSLRFQIVSNTVRMHALETLFSIFFFGLISNFCVESLHYFKKKCIFFNLANAAKYKIVSFNVGFKMSQNAAAAK